MEITSKPYLSQYCRKHLLSHLEGNIAWRDPQQAIAQRERLRQERIAAREQRVEPVPDENLEPTERECGEVSECEENEEMDIEMVM